MSRVGKQVIVIPDGVQFAQEGQIVTISGPKGELSYSVHPDITISVDNNELTCAIAGTVAGRALKHASAHWGTTRSRIANLVTGVTEGFSKKLELHGVGYRASLKGKNIELLVGYSHPVLIEAPEGITFSVENEVITVEGVDAVLVGQVAADIRKVRKPEPYKGKGIRYQDEHVRRKVGKVVGTTA